MTQEEGLKSLMESLKNNTESIEHINKRLVKVETEINEIIDHLPQEKEEVCQTCLNDCKGERVLDTCPNYLAKVWVKHIVKEGSEEHIVYYDIDGQHCSEPNCEINAKRKQPTKEVPDIRIVDTNILWQKLQDRGFDHVQASEAIKVIQEISALYRKEGGL